MNDLSNRGSAAAASTLRRAVGEGLTAVLAVPWLVWGPFGIVCYVGGLFNSMLAFMLVSLAMLPALVIAGTFPVLVVQAVATWRRRTLLDRRRMVLWVTLTAGFIVPYILGIAGLGSSPFDLYVRGFARYAKQRVDVNAIRDWLGTLNPNDQRDSQGVWIEKRLFESEQPSVVARLHPKWAQTVFDERGHLAVRLLWGGGMIGHWGVVVGREDMPTRPSDSREDRISFGPGAYVWGGS